MAKHKGNKIRCFLRPRVVESPNFCPWLCLSYAVVIKVENEAKRAQGPAMVKLLNDYLENFIFAWLDIFFYLAGQNLACSRSASLPATVIKLSGKLKNAENRDTKTHTHNAQDYKHTKIHKQTIPHTHPHTCTLHMHATYTRIHA